MTITNLLITNLLIYTNLVKVLKEEDILYFPTNWSSEIYILYNYYLIDETYLIM